MATPKYRRVIVKLSGEALSGPEKFGIHQATIDRFAADLVASHALGIGLGVVGGGGNILRGAQISEDGLSRPTADAMGMLATVMNALVLEAAIERAGVSARSMSALAMPQVCETYERQRALRHLEDDRVIVFAGGTGQLDYVTVAYGGNASSLPYTGGIVASDVLTGEVRIAHSQITYGWIGLVVANSHVSMSDSLLAHHCGGCYIRRCCAIPSVARDSPSKRARRFCKR